MALVDLSRPTLAPVPPVTDYDRAQHLVHAYGSDTLDYFALRDDKRYFFSSDGGAMIAYGLVGQCALASGDPIGRPASIERVVREFVAMCHGRGWRCAFLAVRGSDAVRYRDLGLRTFYLGEEAVIDCDRFTLAGKRNKSMRQSVQRVARSHQFVMIAESEASADLVAELNELSRRWRGTAPERGFTMALSQEVGGTNPERVLSIAFDGHGVARGFLRLVPLFGGEPGLTLDMMRRDRGSVNGLTEFLITSTVFALRDQGAGRLSMNFAVMGRLFWPDGVLTRGERVLKAAVSLGNPYFQLRSLHEFSRRFRPTWRPRVIAYEGALARVAVLYAGIEGHLTFPLIGRYFDLPRVEHHRGSGRAGAHGDAPLSSASGIAPRPGRRQATLAVCSTSWTKRSRSWNHMM